LKLKSDTLTGFVLCHLLAALAFLPWFFSWTGVVIALLGMFVFGVLGINIGFHRLLTHRSFSCPLWLEHLFAVLGTCALQFSPAFWVAVHRRHHHYADEDRDPHSPLRSFFWSHFGWLLVRPADMKPAVMIDRYSRDLLRDPLYVALERRKNWIKLTFASWLVFFAAGFVAAIAVGESQSAGAVVEGSGKVDEDGARAFGHVDGVISVIDAIFALVQVNQRLDTSATVRPALLKVYSMSRKLP